MTAIDTFEAIRGRRSIRRFTDEPIPDDVVERIIDAARWAPYGTDEDERTFIVLAGEEKARVTRYLDERLAQVLPAMGEGPSRRILRYARSLVPVVETAPVLVVAMTEVGREGPELSIASGACAIENMMIAAQAEGVASCYMTGALYLADEIVHLLGLERHRLLGLIPLGYAADGGATRSDFPTVIWRGFDGKDEESPPEPEEADISTIVEARPGAGERVLVVTDLPDVDRAILDVLERAGYDVVVAQPGEALEVFEQRRPDVTIVDAILGEISGYEIASSIHDAIEGPCPVIITTPAYDAADEEQALTAGASDVLTKPIREHELLARVRALADSRDLYETLEDRAEQLEQANEELRELQQIRDDLTHMIVHDMRTPLTNIISGLQTVEATEYEEDLSREFIPEAIEAGQELADMINNLLDISKMEAGELEPERELLDLCDLVTDAFERVEQLAREGDLDLEAQFDEGIEVNGDPDLLRRVLVNLLGNGIKFTPAGGSVKVEAEAEHDAVVVCVTDTGPGISEEQQEQLFRKFSQLDSEQKHQGTGLGLTFVKLAVEAHGGEVWVESELGEGSSFCFTLPEQ